MKTPPVPQFITKVTKDPYVDWAILLALTALFSISIFGFGIRLYFENKALADAGGQKSTTKAEVQTQSILDVKAIADVDKIFEIKKANLAMYAGTAGAVGTSSLKSSAKKPVQNTAQKLAPQASKWKRPVKVKTKSAVPTATVQ